MAFSFWKKMFGSEGEGSACEVPQEESSVEYRGSEAVSVSESEDASAADMSAESKADSKCAVGDISTLEGFVEYVAKNLVDNAEAVTVSTVEKERISVIQIRCEKKDIGKIIGKSGKTIAALRLLVSGAGGRMGLRVTVDVLD